jgi:hypothetical protein
MTIRNRATAVLLLAAALMLGTWSSIASASLRCCYQGDAADLPAAEVEVKLKDGRTVPFGELFPEFTTSTSLFTSMYPVYKLDIARVVYPHLAVKFLEYDANGNGSIEEPELNVLFMEEVARGLDHPITQLGGESRLRAIFIPAGDIDGLIQLVNDHRSEMKPDARKTFDEIELLRDDFRLDGTVPGEQGPGPYSP